MLKAGHCRGRWERSILFVVVIEDQHRAFRIRRCVLWERHLLTVFFAGSK